MERKLASVQIVSNIEPVTFVQDGQTITADSIEKATVQGWQLVVKKGDFKPGDKCVYFEIDSLLPASDQFNFLSSTFPYRLRTKKFKGVLSQGLALSLSSLGIDADVGTDVSGLLGVTKYEIPFSGSMGGTIKGTFPGFIRKTDEPRLQSNVKVLEEMAGEPVYVTTKLDGTSFTAYYDDDADELVVCSRNNIVADGDNVYWKVAKKYSLDLLLKGTGICIQGEICGPGIQKNRLGLDEHKLYMFDAQKLKGEYLTFTEFSYLCRNVLSSVPSVFDYTWSMRIFDVTLDYWLEAARGKYEGTNNNREGIVIRTTTGTYSNVLQSRFSVKVINNDYLMKEDQ